MYVINQPKKVRFPVADGEFITFTVRDANTEEYQKYLAAAFFIVKGKTEMNMVGASIGLFDKIVIDVEGCHWQNGTGKPQPLTTKTPDWMGKIPPHIKRAVIAELFDQSKAETVEAKNE